MNMPGIPSAQMPLFSHGAVAHSSMSVSQNVPSKPVWQMQSGRSGFAGLSVHSELFSHGSGLHAEATKKGVVE